MDTQNANTSNVGDAGPSANDSVAATPMSAVEHDWLTPAVFIIGAFAALGLVVVAFGAYLTPSITAVVVGVAIMLLAATAWVIAALYLMVGILKRLFSLRRAATTR